MSQLTNAEIRSEVIEQISAQLTQDGFKWNQKRERFTRNQGKFSHHYIVLYKRWGASYKFQPHIGIRSEVVERIFHRTSGFKPADQLGTTTFGNSAGVLMHGKLTATEFPISSSQEIIRTSSSLVEVLRQVAIPYFDKWSSLVAMDQDLNGSPETGTVNCGGVAWFRASRGMILAKLLNRPNIAELRDIYRAVVEKDNSGFYLPMFQRLLDDLDKNGVEFLESS